MGAKLKAFLATIWADIVDTYKRSKLVLLAIAAVVITLEFNRIKEAIAIASAKKVDKDAHTDDTKLAAQETQLNQEADAAVKQAAQETQNEAPVTDDWNKKSD
jgi:hypothetical protein